jgi:hypothetical protein
MVERQPRQIVRETLSQKTKNPKNKKTITKKRAGRVAPEAEMK